MAPRGKKLKSSFQSKTKQRVPNLLDVPDEVILQILNHLSCDQIAQLRIVNMLFYY